MDQHEQQNEIPEQQESMQSTESSTSAPLEPSEGQAPTLRDAVEKAFDSTPPEEGETAAQRTERLRDEAGRFAAKPKDGEQPPTGRTQGAQQGEAPPEKGTLRAPQSWRPEVRQHWDALPPAVKAEVAKREMEVQRGLQETAQARNAVEALKEMISPYMPVVQSRYNGDVAGMIQAHAQTEMRLLAGTQADVAKTITDLIQHYGVGRFGKQFIETLDGSLVGIEPQLSPQDLIQQAVQKQVAPLMQVIEQATNQSRQAQSAQAMQSVEQFSQNAEFYEDVRLQMADLIDLAAQRGQPMSLEEAYVQACWAHPQIRGTLLQRQQQQQGQNRTQAVQRARAAAVSVTGAPAPKPAGMQSGLDRRAAVEAAFDSLSGRM